MVLKGIGLGRCWADYQRPLNWNMLKSDNSGAAASTAAGKSSGEPRTAIDNLMSSFTIKTAKSWTMVSGFEDSNGTHRQKQYTTQKVVHQPVRRTGPPPMMHNGHRHIAPKVPEMSPFALGARRASASGDKAWIESYGLIPNHHFKAQKIIQHFPPPQQPARTGLEPPMKRQSIDKSEGDLQDSTRYAARSLSLPPLSDPPTSGDDSDHPISRGKRNLTFHSLEFDNGVLKQVAKSEASDVPAMSYSRATFVPSEYQHRVSPTQASKSKVQPQCSTVSTVSMASPEASLEAAHILLDFTRINNCN